MLALPKFKPYIRRNATSIELTAEALNTVHCSAAQVMSDHLVQWSLCSPQGPPDPVAGCLM